MITTVDLRDSGPAAVDAGLQDAGSLLVPATAWTPVPVVSAPFLRERLDAISVG